MDDRPALLPAPGVSLLYQPDGSWAALVGYAQFTQEAPSWSGPGPDPSTDLVAETTHFRVPGHKPRRPIGVLSMSPAGRLEEIKLLHAEGLITMDEARALLEAECEDRVRALQHAETHLEAETTHVRVPGHRHRPCAHGTEGAAADPSICSVCVHEREERIDETCRQVRAEAHRERLGYTALRHGPAQYQRAAALAAEAQLARMAAEMDAAAHRARERVGARTGYRTSEDIAGEARCDVSRAYVIRSSSENYPEVGRVATVAGADYVCTWIEWNAHRFGLSPLSERYSPGAPSEVDLPFVEWPGIFGNLDAPRAKD